MSGHCAVLQQFLLFLLGLIFFDARHINHTKYLQRCTKIKRSP